jgi:two-component system, cell cycle response regulator
LSAEHSQLVPGALAGARILVAEDSNVQAHVTRRALEEAGSSVRVETDGFLALAALDEEHFDLLVTDWMMPNCNGLELVRAVRSREDLAGLYIVFLTTLDEKDQMVEGLSAGADDYVGKPFHPGELVARVRAGYRLVELQAKLRAANDALGRLAMTDPLTELANRRAFDDLLAAEAASFARGGPPFCVARIDLDRFKTVNDEHGHDVGDLLLVAVAGALRTGIRANDLAARIGGDEFVLMFRACSTDEAIVVCERVQARLGAIQVPVEGGTISASASMGIAQIRHSLAAAETMAHADEALYSAKRDGGRAIVAADERAQRPTAMSGEHEALPHVRE